MSQKKPPGRKSAVERAAKTAKSDLGQPSLSANEWEKICVPNRFGPCEAKPCPDLVFPDFATRQHFNVLCQNTSSCKDRDG